jgi:hypothetical protein
MTSDSSARNLCIFCDGTGALLGAGAQTNVVKLMAACGPSPTQLVFYDPGVGTDAGLPATTSWQKFKGHMRKLWGLALGEGVFQNIAQAYLFLVDNYDGVNDRLFFFGFSRGAFTVRAVAGMVAMFGIVRPQSSNLVEYMIQIYFSEDSVARTQLVADIRNNSQKFSALALPTVHFVGVWDTVASVGIPARRRKFSQAPTIAGKRFSHVRQAVSADDYRAPFEVRLYELPCDAHQTVKQVLFSGVHSDVGGQYRDAGLSNQTLDWITAEAQLCGLEVNHVSLAAQKARCSTTVLGHDQAYQSPIWALAGLRDRRLNETADIQFTDRQLTPGTEPGGAQSVWRPLLARRIVFWLPALLTVAFFLLNFIAVSWGTDFAAEHQGQAVRIALNWGAWFAPGALRTLAAEQPQLTHGLRLGLLFDLGLIASLTALFCVLIVHGRIVIARSAAASIRATKALFSKVAVGLTWFWLASDLLEDLCLLLGTRDWWWQPDAADRAFWLRVAWFFGFGKFGALGLLCLVLSFAFLASLTPRRASSSVNA